MSAMDKRPTPTGPTEPIRSALDTRSTVSGTRERGESRAKAHPDLGKSLRVPDHTLLRCIGGGSYGEVWLCRNVMGVYRAVKVVFRSTFDDERPYEREFNGIRLYEPVSRTHDDLIDVLQVGRDDHAGYFYYVMELADDEFTGQDIDPEKYQPRTLGAEIVRHGRLPFQECLRLGLSLSDGLSHLQRKGLIHRDIKPSNIVFVHGIPKIADIGLVAEVGSAHSYVGTEGFMPPEGPGTAQADIYSLGKVLYEISSGKDRKTFPQLPTLLEGTTESQGYLEMNEVILRACDEKPTRRYASAEAMHADLLLLKAGKSVRRLHQLELRLAQLRRLAVVALLVALLGGAVYFQITREIQHAADLRHRQAAQLVSYGARQLEQRDYLGSLPGFVAALALDGRDPHRAETHRTRIAAVLDQTPTLLSYWLHGVHVHGVAISHDGRWCALAANDGNPENGIVAVWDLRGGDQPVWQMPHKGSRLCVAFRSDNLALAAGGVDGFAVYDLTGAEPGISADVQLINTTIYGIAFSPAGDQLVTAGYQGSDLEGRVDLWDAQTGEPIIPFLARADFPFRYANFSPDGRRITVAGEGRGSFVADELDKWQGWTQVLDLTTRSFVGTPVIHEGEGWVYDADFSPDGRMFVTASLDRTARICDARTGEVIRVLEHPARVRTARFSPDGRYVVTAGSDASARIWDVSTGQQAFPPLKDVARHLEHASFTAAGRHVVTVSATSGIGLWDLSELWDLSALNRSSPPARRIYSEFRDHAARLTNSIIVLETIGGEPLDKKPLEAGFPIANAIFNRNGTGLLAYSHREEEAGPETRLARFWWLGTGDPVDVSFRCDDRIRNAYLSDDGRWLISWYQSDLDPDDDPYFDCVLGAPWLTLLTSRTDDDPYIDNFLGVQVHDLSADPVRVIQLLPGSEVRFARFNHASNRLVVTSDKTTVTLWDLPPLQEPRLTILCEDIATHVAFSLDDRRMTVACHSDGRLQERAAHVYDTRTGRELLPPLGHGDGVVHAEFSPDNRTIVTSGEDYQARIWDTATGQLLRELDHPHQVYSARFSRDGRWIVTVCRDQRTRVWDAETGEPITPPLQQPWPATTAWFVENAHAVVTLRRITGQMLLSPLPRETRPLADLMTLARKLSGRQIPHTGLMLMQPRETLLADWQRVQAESMPDLSASGGRTVEWHRYHAGLSEAQQNWHAAVFHWSRLVSLEPQKPGWSERLDAARTRANSAE